ncbi:MAG: adenosylmethionine--8-amino-7-oxononanoate transaminase [Cyanobacteria bacterium NC_groundwater_1444_Ag_S-0.65um_54_12]|nr:adenosylmethionine--8-amino-7-oxononanoate transaminase [Cyanobacteria bacterium NC_groundwater_1444_Ag_S-0.65um_54_12]
MADYTYQELADKNKKYLWHPFTQMKEYQDADPIIIASGRGTKLSDVNGNTYYDGISSMWLNVHGHGVAELDQAICEQLKAVAHSTLFGLAHAPAILLAEKLVSLAPPGLTRVFYSDSGAEAVEIAIKMAFQYWQNRGFTKKRSFACMQSAYHGDTLGAVSVGALSLYHELFRPLLFSTYQVPYPDPYRQGGAVAATGKVLVALETLLRERASELCALILEPIVQGAAGMIVMPPGCLEQIVRLLRQYDVLLIADEVATGFGRTGKMFACEHEGITPDLMTLAKGITGGYLPLAATLATSAIYEAFYADYEENKTFFHGHSYTGNPLGCAVALANLQRFETHELLTVMARNVAFVAQKLAAFAQLAQVGDVRQKGLMIGIELVRDRERRQPYEGRERIGVQVCRRARELGLLIRPLGNVITFLPPLASSRTELDEMLAILYQAICQVTEPVSDDR